MAANVAENDDSMALLATELASAMERIGSADTGFDMLSSHVNNENNNGNSNENAKHSIPPNSSLDTASPEQKYSSLVSDPVNNVQDRETASSSPLDQFTTPQHSLELNRLVESTTTNPDESMQSTNDSNTNSSSKKSITSNRKRSMSGAGVLSRLTSRTSILSLDKPKDPSEPLGSGKVDKAALTNKKSKYKSGANWDNPDFQNVQEPFEAASSPVEERNVDLGSNTEMDEETYLRSLASAGGTKAALAQARSNTIGAPIFLASRRAAIEASQAAAFNSAQTANPSRQFGSLSPKGSENRSPETLSPVQSTNHGEVSNARLSGDSNQKYTTEQAQRVLQSARDAVAMSNAAMKVSALDTSTAPNSDSVSVPAPVKTEDENTSVSVDDEIKLAKKKTRKSFMGFGVGKEKKEKDEKLSSKIKEKTKIRAASSSSTTDKGSLSPSEQGAEARRTASGSGSDTSPQREKSGSIDGTNSLNGTQGRRRRFNDTRELGLVASQLAAEALLPPQVDPSRHASMMGVLASGSNGFPIDGSSSNSSSVHAKQQGLGMPQPAFANEARSNSPSLNGNSPLSGSPRTVASDLPKFEQPRAAFARSTYSGSLPGSPSLTQSAKLSGLPSDMLTGLSDGPYPHLPPRSYDLSDPFGIPVSPSEYEIPSINLGSRNSLPNVIPYRTRGMSSGSNGRRSVLQMSMHNPEQELQGLTKKPKSGKSTPFGSRAPSRQPTPKSSMTNLREAVKDAGAASNTSSTINLESSGSKGIENVKGSRKSIFGIKKNKSSAELNKSSTKEQNQQLKPPSPKMNGGSSSSNHGGESSNRPSASSDSITSRRQVSGPSELTNSSNAAHIERDSPQSLVKVPSPTMTSTSGSSHERSAIGSSSEGGNSYGNLMTSTATTPEVTSAKTDLYTQSQQRGSPLPPSQMSERRQMQNWDNGDAKPNVTSTLVTSTPIYESLSVSKDSKYSKELPSAPSPSPQSTAKPVNGATTVAPQARNGSIAQRPQMSPTKSQSKVGRFMSRFNSSKDLSKFSIPSSKSNVHLESNPVPPLPTSTTQKHSNTFEKNGTMKKNESRDSLPMEKSAKPSSKFGHFRSNLQRDWLA